jgi:Fuc2NAc and GlcNAc transferase
VTLIIATLAPAALVVAWLVTRAMCRVAPALGLVAVPNDRSSHSRAIPRAGGVAIVCAVSGAFAILAAVGELPSDLFHVFVTGGCAVALLGLIDDRLGLPPLVRLVIHIFVAGWAVTWLYGPPTFPMQAASVLQDVALVLAVVWALNLFNFMDGIDGLAGSQAVFVTLGAALIAWLTGVATSATSLGAVIAASCLGFLAWNWQPARIFMGDVGSGYLGYLLAALALVSARDEAAASWVWLILGGSFLVDATVTLVIRVLHGEKPWEAHRNHAYQKLSRSWGSHARVSSAFLVVDLLWLFPAAVLAAAFPGWAPAIALLAVAPLIALALLIGAGRPER